MSNEEWSEWIDNDSGEIPESLSGQVVSVKYRDGVINNGVHAGRNFDQGGSCPERNAGDWSIDGVDRDIIAYRHRIEDSGISDPDEEECLQLAYERMNDESVKVSLDAMHHMDWSTTITDTPEEAAMVEDMVNGKSDMVNAPPHYQLRPGYEVYDLRQDLAAKAANGGATYAQYSDWDRATEYLLRMWGKNKLEDLKKCRWYVDKLIEKLEAE